MNAISVRDFGATGDGVALDTSAIQEIEQLRLVESPRYRIGFSGVTQRIVQQASGFSESSGHRPRQNGAQALMYQQAEQTPWDEYREGVEHPLTWVVDVLQRTVAQDDVGCGRTEQGRQ